MGDWHKATGSDWYMKELKHYLKVYKRIMEIAAQLLVEWRSGFLIWSIVHAVELAINLGFFAVILQRTPIVGGWDIYQLAILMGYMEMLIALGGLTFYPMMYNFGEDIRNGDFDLKLCKPMDIQFIASFPWTDVSDLFSLVTGLFMITFGLVHVQSPHLITDVALFIVLLVSSMIILYSMIILLLTLSFKVTQLESISNLYWTMTWMGKYPVSVYKGLTHFIFMFVIPVGLVASVPARTLAGYWEPKYIISSLLMAPVLFLVSRRVFLDNIRHYTSASS